MGFKPGEGLGRKKKGLAHALEVVKRPDQMGLGYAGTERKLVKEEEKPEASGSRVKE